MTTSAARTISIRLIWPFRAVSQQLGVDSTEAWAALGFSPEQLADPDLRIPVELAQQMAAWVIEQTGLTDYGIHAAEAAEPGLFDLPEYAAWSQTTLGGAFSSIARLLPLLSDAAVLEAEERGNVISVSIDAVLPLHSSSVEFSFAYFILAARRFSGIEDLSPEEVRFRHAAPPVTDRHERFFGCPVRFSAKRDELLLPTDQFQIPLKTADSRLSELLDRVAEQELEQNAVRTTFADEVRRLISRYIPSDGAPVTTIARHLGITPRTLHRRLADENTTYRDLADNVRKGLALGYLERADLAVSEIAYLLGFSGIQAFHRAFKRWTNETPGAYRRRLKNERTTAGTPRK